MRGVRKKNPEEREENLTVVSPVGIGENHVHRS